jgi:DNA-binding NarL/FixJ family response regulator
VPTIRVFLCDDGESFRALMRYTLPEDGDIEVVGEAGDGDAAVRGVAELQPDVVLLDLSMPARDGLEAIPEMVRRAPSVRVVALSGFGAERMAAAALAQGASAYVEKGEGAGAIRAAIRAAAHR